MEGDAHRQDAGVGRSARVLGTHAAGDDAIGDVFDRAPPGRLGVSLGGDSHRASLGAARDVELVDLGLDPDAVQVGERDDLRGDLKRLAGAGMARRGSGSAAAIAGLVGRGR